MYNVENDRDVIKVLNYLYQFEKYGWRFTFATKN